MAGAFEDVVLARAGSSMVATRLKALVAVEARKGCEASITPDPVALEPVFRPMGAWCELPPALPVPQAIPESPWAAEALCRFQVWVSEVGISFFSMTS